MLVFFRFVRHNVLLRHSSNSYQHFGVWWYGVRRTPSTCPTLLVLRKRRCSVFVEKMTFLNPSNQMLPFLCRIEDVVLGRNWAKNSHDGLRSGGRWVTKGIEFFAENRLIASRDDGLVIIVAGDGGFQSHLARKINLFPALYQRMVNRARSSNRRSNYHYYQMRSRLRCRR